jgi:hypothetical protein
MGTFKGATVSEGGGTRLGAGKLILWFFLAVVTLVVVVMLSRGTPPSEMSFAGMKVTYNSPTGSANSVSREEFDQRQRELEEQLQGVKAKAAQEGRASKTTDPGAGSDGQRQANVTGVWQGPFGLGYQFYQYGSNVAFQESRPDLGITAVGEGYIVGNHVNLTYRSAFSYGQSVLTLSADGRQLSGTIQDASGQVTPIQISRA